MTENLFLVQAGRWVGWQELPVSLPGWGPSPIFVVDVEPLKTGKNILRLEFVLSLHPKTAVRKLVSLRVIYRAPSHIVGTYMDDGVLRTAFVSEINFDWIKTLCPVFWERRPPYVPALAIVSNSPPQASKEIELHLNSVLGRNEKERLSGASLSSFCPDENVPPRPDRVTTIAIERTFKPFDSWLIARGFVPREMEDKWFIYMEQGRLIFRRSWTRYLIYDVEVEWIEDRIRLGSAKVNRDKRQYEETRNKNDYNNLLSVVDGSF